MTASHTIQTTGVVSTEAQQSGITAAHDTGGIQVKQAGSMFTTEVHSAADLGDSDVVTVSGMQMTVRDARNMGMLESLFGKTSASANEGNPASTESAPEDEGATPQDLYAEAVGNLSEHQAAGTMPTEEVRSYELVLGQVTMQGLDIEDAAEMYEAIDDGELDPNSVNDETRHLMKQAEAQVEQAAVASITRELGADGLAELTRYADASPAAWREMRRYAIARSMGTQGQTTWTDVLNVVRRSLR